METPLLTLSKIFNERLLRIPDYQRGYAWGDKQLNDFWNDLQRVEANRNHYTGVLSLEEVPSKESTTWCDDTWIINAKNYSAFYVVDGQQRLTTSIVLIQVIIESLEDGQKLNYTSKEEIRRKFICESKDDGISMSFIFGYEKDNPSYEHLKTKILGFRSEHNNSQSTVYTQNLDNAKTFFSDRIKSITFNERELIYRKVTQNLLFNVFAITDDVDVCMAFETMNNRGKPLTQLELLKNRLIFLSLQLPVDVSEQLTLRKIINNCWREIYHALGVNAENPLSDDQFLTTHFMLYYGPELMIDDESKPNARYYRHLNFAVSESALLDRIFTPLKIGNAVPEKERLTIQSIFKYVTSLQDAVRVWSKMQNPLKAVDLSPEVQVWLDKLSRVGSRVAAPLLLQYMSQDDNVNARSLFLKTLERYLFIRSLRYFYEGYRYHEVEPYLMGWALALASKKKTGTKILEELNAHLVESMKGPDFIREISNVFKSNGFYTWAGLKYFLFEYELSLQESSKTDRSKIFWPEFAAEKVDYMTVEHIYPQNARHGYWTSRFSNLSQRQKEGLRNSLGNLVPLSKPKNSSLSNRPFDEKRDGADEDSVVAYRFGSYSEIEVASDKEWTADTIKKRGLRLLEFMERRWCISLGSLQNKLKMLDLEFME